MQPSLPFSNPQIKEWRYGPCCGNIPANDLVWFIALTPTGNHYECLTGIVLECTVIPAGPKEGDDSTVYTLRVGSEVWYVDASRVFEVWEDCDKEARIYSKWVRQLREKLHVSSSKW